MKGFERQHGSGRGEICLLIEKAWADPQPLAHSKIQMTNWLELQREKGESAHDAWKVGEESDSKPSAIDHVELKHLRKKLRTFG